MSSLKVGVGIFVGRSVSFALCLKRWPYFLLKSWAARVSSANAWNVWVSGNYTEVRDAQPHGMKDVLVLPGDPWFVLHSCHLHNLKGRPDHQVIRLHPAAKVEGRSVVNWDAWCASWSVRSLKCVYFRYSAHSSQNISKTVIFNFIDILWYLHSVQGPANKCLPGCTHAHLMSLCCADQSTFARIERCHNSVPRLQKGWFCSRKVPWFRHFGPSCFDQNTFLLEMNLISWHVDVLPCAGAGRVGDKSSRFDV